MFCLVQIFKRCFQWACLLINKRTSRFFSTNFSVQVFLSFRKNAVIPKNNWASSSKANVILIIFFFLGGGGGCIKYEIESQDGRREKLHVVVCFRAENCLFFSHQKTQEPPLNHPSPPTLPQNLKMTPL